MNVQSVSAGNQQGHGASAATPDQTHTVQRGETLWEIAQRYGVSLSELIAANPQILNPDVIYADQVIRLPGHAGGNGAQPDAIGGDGAQPVQTAATAATDSTYTGGPLSRVQLAQLFYQAGFRGENLVNMVAIAMRESGGDPTAFNGNAGTGDNSYGLTQINMIGDLGPARLQQFGIASADQLFDPLTNARAAFILSENGTDLTPWGGYKGMWNTYNTDLPAARAAVEQAQAQGLLGQPFQPGGVTNPAPAPAAPSAINASDASSMPILRIGARGEAVADLQRRLQAVGFSPGPIDGWFGPQTQAAVRAFQQSRGITVDGWVGPQTWDQLLNTGTAPAPTDGRLVRGASGPAVQELQQLLQSAGYYHGNIGGNFGPLTDAAVRSFQRDHGLTVDGWAGPQTMAALREAVQGGGTPPVTPAPPVTGAPNAEIQAALDFGLSQLGAPYVGGGSPYRFGDPGNGEQAVERPRLAAPPRQEEIVEVIGRRRLIGGGSVA